MYLVDDEYHVALTPYLLDKSLHAALELTSKLRSRNKGGEVKKIDLLVLKLYRHLLRGDPLRKSLRHGGLADARLTDEAGVVLLAAVEYLNDPLQLLLAPYHTVELSFSCPLRQVYAIAVKVAFLDGSGAFPALRGCAAVAVIVRLFRILTAEKTVQKREGSRFAVVAVGFVTVGIVEPCQLLDAVERTHHLPGQVVEVLVGDPHSVHKLINGLYVQLSCALEAKSFVLCFAVFDLRNKHDRNILSAS